jgi:AmiR/NasT family two-component response regulator
MVDPREVPPADRRLAQALADVATIGILQQRSLHRSHVLSEQLQNALTSRVAIEQAKGVLAERGQLMMDAAFDALRRYARDHNEKLTDVAHAVITTGLDPTAR